MRNAARIAMLAAWGLAAAVPARAEAVYTLETTCAAQAGGTQNDFSLGSPQSASCGAAGAASVSFSAFGSRGTSKASANRGRSADNVVTFGAAGEAHWLGDVIGQNIKIGGQSGGSVRVSAEPFNAPYIIRLQGSGSVSWDRHGAGTAGSASVSAGLQCSGSASVGGSDSKTQTGTAQFSDAQTCVVTSGGRDQNGFLTAVNFGGSAVADASDGPGRDLSYQASYTLSVQPRGLMLAKVSGDNQTNVAGRALKDALTVAVIDNEPGFMGPLPGAGVPITFSLKRPGSDTHGGLSAASAVTDPSGHASVRLTLGNDLGTYVVTAACPTCHPAQNSVDFNEAAAAMSDVTALREIFCDGSGFTGTPVMNALRVQAYNTLSPSEGVAGFQVDFAVVVQPASAGGAALSPAADTTGDSPKALRRGIAQTTLTLGNTPGTYTVEATCAQCAQGRTVRCPVLAIEKPESSYATPTVPVFQGGYVQENPDAQNSPRITVTVTPAEVIPVDGNGTAVVAGPTQAGVAIAGPPNADCTAFLFPTEFTGGHQHDTTRPPGSLKGLCHIGPDGTGTLEYDAGEVGGQERIVVNIAGVGQAIGFVKVKVPNMVMLPPNNNLYRVNSGDKNNHPVYYYSTPGMRDIITQVAADYKAAKGMLLSFNDMSLINGGLFDDGGTWSDPHKSHRKGTSVDVNHRVILLRRNRLIREPPRVDESFLNSDFGGRGCGRCVEPGSIHFECPATTNCP